MSYDEIFERVSKLVESVSVKSASTKRAAEDERDNVEEYNVWSEIDPKDQKFMKAVDQLLSEAVPASPTNTEEAEEGTEEELQEAYPTTDVSSAGEGDVDAEVESAVQGIEEIKESTLKRASDYTLVSAFNRLSQDLVSYIAAQDHTVKNAALTDVDSISAVCVADLVKQAQFDASLVFGYLTSIKSAADEDADSDEDKESIEDSVSENTEGVSEEEVVADAIAENVEKAIDDLPQILATIEENPEVLKEIKKLIESVPESELDEIISAIVEEYPEAALQAVRENPEVADALIDALSNTGAVAEGLGKDSLREVLSKAEENETPEEEAQESPEFQKIEEELDTEKHGAFAQLSALDAAMQELGVTPEDIELSVAGTNREEEGIKIAAAIREFRKKPASKVANSDIKLRVAFKRYLRDLMFGS